MRKEKLMKGLRRAVIIVGILTLSCSITACGGTSKTEPTSSTAVETVEESKDFSMNLAESQLAEVENLSDKELAEFQSAADELQDNTVLSSNGEVLEASPEDNELTEEDKELGEQLKNRLQNDLDTGEVSMDNLDEVIGNIFSEYSADYRAQVKAEIEQANSKEFVSNETQSAVTESKPQVTESKSQVTESKPANTSKSNKQSSKSETQPKPQNNTVEQPTQAPVVEQPIGSGDLTPEERELLKQAADEGNEYWEEGAENNQHKMDSEEINGWIK